jgi:hypothetical protein
MKKLFSALFVVAMAVGMGACGESPCDKLKKQCDGCEDTTAKGLCQASYETTQLPLIGTGDDGCQDILDSGTYDSCK